MLGVYLLGWERDSTVSLKELFIDSKIKELICCECIPPAGIPWPEFASPRCYGM